MVGVELFNKTNMVKILPKYNYNGKIKLQPQKTYSIEPYMVDFYRPFEKVGIMVRHKHVSDAIEAEVKNVIEESNDNTSKEVSEVIIEDPVIEVFSDNIETTRDGGIGNILEEFKVDVETPKKSYTEEDFEFLKISDMKKILSDRGIDYSSIPNKRNAFKEAILKSQ